MENIPFSAVRQWKKTPHNYGFPSSINQICPHCGDLVTFTTSVASNDTSTKSISLRSACPGCHDFVSFWAVRADDSSGDPSEIFMYPKSKPVLLAADFPDSVPLAIRKSFDSAASSFITKNYPATAVMARRTLEGIFKYLLPETDRGGTLAVSINKVMQGHDLAAPLSTLAHAIRGGGNLGAHFDEENEPTEAMAMQMVELLRYLISYLYVLPNQIQELETSLAKQPPA
ncbi:DUF4145 domain-containing protein [Pseudomonas putida]|uniref:DUF4145 domain-containing protein n=1 Tax=Pseudomonas putida TaxID=303 RepID=UPI003736CCD0